MRDESVSIDESAGLIPIQAAIGDSQLNSAVFIRQTGILSSIAGLLGPDILVAVAANSVTYSAVANTITFGLASTIATTTANITTINATTVNAANFDASAAYKRGGTQVVTARQTGWGAASGTLSRAAYASYAGQTVSNPPTQAEMQALDDAVKLLSQTVAALITDIRTHGLIGS